ncbi:dihydroneopterin aldolase [Candidatus Gracilibacteria bacterium]|nr:dihydroneopterin aldolase [Candidatus Gracilibacteria bacterium]
MKFLLRDIEIFVHLGVSDEERKKSQKVLVSISFEYDTRKAEQSDDIADTVDYFALEQFLRNFPSNKEFHLLEKLHRDLFDAIQKQFPEIQNVRLTVQKFPFESGSIVMKN